MTKTERVATSIKIKPEVWKKAKIEAIKCDSELSELVEKTLDRWINVESEKILKAKKKNVL